MVQENEKIVLTVFTDPMMGLSYEMEPVFRKLETHFPGVLEIRPCMNVLVKNVYDFVDPGDLTKGKEYALGKYLKKLSGIYESEEWISGMPINMEGFCLFSDENTTSRPLCLAYKAAELAAPDKATYFLYNLRYATIVDCRPTTRLDEILAVVERTGIEKGAFLKEYEGDRAKEALKTDQALGLRLGIHTLPAYLLQYQGRGMLFQTFSYQDFVSAIEEISKRNIQPVDPRPAEEALRKLLRAHPLISPIEIREAFDLADTETVRNYLEVFLEKQEIRIKEVPHGWFVERYDGGNEGEGRKEDCYEKIDF